MIYDMIKLVKSYNKDAIEWVHHNIFFRTELKKVDDEYILYLLNPKKPIEIMNEEQIHWMINYANGLIYAFQSGYDFKEREMYASGNDQ